MPHFQNSAFRIQNSTSFAFTITPDLAGTGSIITLTAVPEPASLSLLVLSTAGLLLTRRRRA